MLHLLELLPGEHIAAFPGRFHRVSASGDFAKTCKYLGIASTDMRARCFIAKRQIAGDSRLSGLFSIDSEHIASYCNFITPFLSDFYEAHSNSAECSVPKITMLGERSIENDHWRWCSVCLEEDQDNFGISYYHYQHQIPGVFFCQKHNTRLISSCDRCQFSVRLIRQSYIPPQDNRCPSCTRYFTEDSTYYDETMHSIEQVISQLINFGTQFRLMDFTSHIAKSIGINPEQPISMQHNKQLNDWKKFIQSYLNLEVHNTYFRMSSQKIAPIKVSPLLTDARLYKAKHSEKVLHPLVYIIALKATGHEIFNI